MNPIVPKSCPVCGASTDYDKPRAKWVGRMLIVQCGAGHCEFAKVYELVEKGSSGSKPFNSDPELPEEDE